MKYFALVGALAGALTLAVVPTVSATAVTGITADVGSWVQAGETADVSVGLSGATGEDLVVTMELADGTMSVDNAGLALALQPGSVTFTDVSTITFTGPSVDVTTALSERLNWTARDAPERSYLRLSISVGSFYEGLVTDTTTGQRYLQSEDLLSWVDARDAAAALSYNGLTGYLATITSPEENSFVTAQAGGATAYIAATSEIEYINPLLAPENQYATEFDARGRYHWGAGPEAGMEITWAQWFPGEPNGYASERCLLTNWGGPNGQWNDGGCAPAYIYLVEFGGVGTETGPAQFTNLDAPPPAEPEPELAATGAEILPAWAVGSIALLVGLGLLMLRRAGHAALRPGA